MPSIALFFNVVIAIMYGVYLWRTGVEWRHYRDGRALRAFVMSVMVEALALSTLVRTALVTWLGVTQAGTFVIYSLWGMSLVGGIFLIATWRGRP